MDTFAEGMLQVVDEVRAEGHKSLRAMAREFNRRGVQSARGGRWHHTKVRNLVERQRADRFAWREGDVTVSRSEQA